MNIEESTSLKKNYTDTQGKWQDTENAPPEARSLTSEGPEEDLVVGTPRGSIGLELTILERIMSRLHVK